MDQLRDDQVRDLIVDRRSEEDDAFVQQTRIDVERALAARGLFDHHRNERAHLAPSRFTRTRLFISDGRMGKPMRPEGDTASGVTGSITIGIGMSGLMS